MLEETIVAWVEGNAKSILVHFCKNCVSLRWLGGTIIAKIENALACLSLLSVWRANKFTELVHSA